MKKRIPIWAVYFVALIAWTVLAFAQTATPGAMKTVKLSNGQEVFDMSGEWDVLAEHYDSWAHFGTYSYICKITQEGTSFTGIRLKDSPPPATGKAGGKCFQGEVDKNGIKKIEAISGQGSILPGNCKISENGNKINVDVPRMIRITMTR